MDLSGVSTGDLKVRLMQAKKDYRIYECIELCEEYLKRDGIKHRNTFEILLEFF
jgi:hypothetical protein